MSESDSNNEETFNDFSSTSISDSDNEEPFNTEFTGDIVKLKPYDFEPLVPNNCQVETVEDSLSSENQDSSFHLRVGNVHWCECNE